MIATISENPHPAANIHEKGNLLINAPPDQSLHYFVTIITFCHNGLKTLLTPLTLNLLPEAIDCEHVRSDNPWKNTINAQFKRH